MAFYGELGYQFTDKLHGLLGGRWFDVGEEEAVTAQPDPAPYGDPD